MTATVVCVLKTGGDYDYGHVARLVQQVRAHGRGVPFTCLTDDPRAMEAGYARPLSRGWPGWWSKAEAWSLPGPILLLDLDVTITNDLAPLLEVARQHDLVACRNFWDGDRHHINSSVVAWRGNAGPQLHEAFVADPEGFMCEYGPPPQPFRWGDQGFIAEHALCHVEMWQDLLPGAVLSFKRDLLRGADASRLTVCVSHGQPKPWAADGADAWLAAHKIFRVERQGVVERVATGAGATGHG